MRKIKAIPKDPIADGCYRSMQLVDAETGEPLKLGKKRTITIKIDGDKVSTDWWTPEIKELFCDICGKSGTTECNKTTCQVANPWCG